MAAWLLAPYTVDEFFERYYQRAPLHISRKAAAYYSQYFSLNELERVLYGCELRTSDINIVRDGTGSRPEMFVREKPNKTQNKEPISEIVNPDRMSALFASGCTVVLDNVPKFSPSFASLTLGLSRALGCVTGANVYVTPGAGQGFGVHWDTHDTVIVQIAGTKHWRVYDSPLGLPLLHQYYDKKAHPVGEIALEMEMEPGDLLYIPRGFLHEARANDELSMHVTIGLYPSLWHDVVAEAINAASENDVELRRVAEGTPTADLREALTRALSDENLAAAYGRLRSKFVTQRDNLLDGQLSQIAALKQLSDDSSIAIRPGLLYEVKQDEKSTKLLFSGKTVTFGPSAAAIIRELEAASPLKAGTLRKHDEKALNVVRRLIQEGFALQLSSQGDAAAVA